MSSATNYFVNSTDLSNILQPITSSTWTQQTSPAKGWTGIASDSTGQYLVAVAGTSFDGIWRSTDYGDNWTYIYASNNLYFTSIASSSNGTHLSTCAQKIGSVGGIYYSTNSGVTFIKSNAPNGEWYSITCNSSGQYHAACEYPGNIYTSSNNGASWTVTSAPGSLYWISITMNSTGDRLAAVVRNGHIYTSSDYGSTWTQTSAPNTAWNSIACDSTGQRLAAVVQYGTGGIWTSNDYGSNWTQTSAEIYAPWITIASNSTGQYLAATCNSAGTINGVYLSSDYGVTWYKSILTEPIQYWNIITSNSSGFKLAAATRTPSATGNIYTYNLPANSTNIYVNDNDLNTIFAPNTTNPVTYTTTNYIVENYTPLWTSTPGNYDLGQIFQNK